MLSKVGIVVVYNLIIFLCDDRRVLQWFDSMEESQVEIASDFLLSIVKFLWLIKELIFLLLFAFLQHGINVQSITFKLMVSKLIICVRFLPYLEFEKIAFISRMINDYFCCADLQWQTCSCSFTLDYFQQKFIKTIFTLTTERDVRWWKIYWIKINEIIWGNNSAFKYSLLCTSQTFHFN